MTVQETGSEEARDLVARADPRKHLTQNYRQDPSLTIHRELLRIHGPERAERFLAYRKLYEEARTTRTAPPHPLSLNLALADACQLRCPHCYRQHNPEKSDKRRLSWDEIRRILDEAADIGVPAMLIGTESEALMHTEAIRALEYATEKGFLDIFVASNGLLLTDEVIDKLFELNVTRLTVSLDAATAETYAKVRGGDFDLLVGNVLNFLRRRREADRRLPVLRVTFVSFNLNRHEAGAFTEYWTAQGADTVDIQALLEIRNVNTLPYDDIDEMTCTYPWEMVEIKWNGEYKPCCSEFNNHLRLGGIDDYGIAGYWASDKLKELRDSMRSGRTSPRACINCMKSLFSDAEYPPLDGS